MVERIRLEFALILNLKYNVAPYLTFKTRIYKTQDPSHVIKTFSGFMVLISMSASKDCL